jgi:hypothetical protein
MSYSAKNLLRPVALLQVGKTRRIEHRIPDTEAVLRIAPGSLIAYLFAFSVSRSNQKVITRTCRVLGMMQLEKKATEPGSRQTNSSCNFSDGSFDTTADAETFTRIL